jgi:UDP-N-acetylmuramoyl-L-alanyl-D-glutamate--2,6-diaminopimelate ligase
MQLHTPTQAAQWLGSHVRGTLRSDSRQLQPGDGFIAWPGAATDGRNFVASALAKGAGACLVEHEGVAAFGLGDGEVATYAGLKSDTGAIASEFFGHPSRELDVIAVTGTNGKTSTVWWLAQALDRAQRPAGMIGTLGVGRPPSALVSTGLTTPDPVQVQQSLRSFVDQGLRACAMEASSIGIEEHRLEGTDIRVAIFTNFTQDHMDYHGSMQAYWESKRRLFDWEGLRGVVVNLDDVRGLELAQSMQERTSSAADLWTISCQRDARLVARDIHHAAQGVRFCVAEGSEIQVLQTRVIGSYNVSNLLGVVAALRSLGVHLADAVQACADLPPVPGRMECVGALGQPLIAVDYAHTPDALAHALEALRPLVQTRGGQLWCVFGCGGDRDAAKRPLMGAIAAKLADRVVVTSDNPRGEKPEAIIAQILLGLPQSASVQVQSDRAVAIAQTVADASDRDVVLLAGKGHEQTQEVAGKKAPFSDIEHARQALALRGTAPEASA